LSEVAHDVSKNVAVVGCVGVEGSSDGYTPRAIVDHVEYDTADPKSLASPTELRVPLEITCIDDEVRAEPANIDDRVGERVTDRSQGRSGDEQHGKAIDERTRRRLELAHEWTEL
jgi:hypothetical protein